MSATGQRSTKSAYEDPEIVDGYIQRNALKPKQLPLLESFSKLIDGTQVLDLGCGPGHDSYLFASHGFSVTGLDYSHEMIRRARTLKAVTHPPTFVVGDMRKLLHYFSPNSFDAIWASASLLHIVPEDLPDTLRGITAVAKNNAVIYVGLKGGTGTCIVEEDKLGKPMHREFTLWERDTFMAEVAPFGWQLVDFSQRDGSAFRGAPANWLQFIFNIHK